MSGQVNANKYARLAYHGDKIVLFNVVLISGQVNRTENTPQLMGMGNPTPFQSPVR